GDRLVGVHGLDLDTDAAVALARHDVGDHRPLAAGRDILAVRLTALLDGRGTAVLIKQVSRGARRLRAHLRESRDGELIVGVAGDDLLELNHAVVDAARGLRVGGLERADRTIPDQDAAI